MFPNPTVLPTRKEVEFGSSNHETPPTTSKNRKVFLELVSVPMQLFPVLWKLNGVVCYN